MQNFRTIKNAILPGACFACAALLSYLTLQADETPANSPSNAVKQEPAEQPESLEVFPQRIELNGSRQRMHLVVMGRYADGRSVDLTRSAQFTPVKEQVAAVKNGVVHPLANGETEIVVRVGDREGKAKVVVRNFDQAELVSFRYEVLPALSKQGCSGGACHGSPSGKGGFRLSLHGFDPELDRRTLIREEHGRRANALQPEQSLLLLKPMMKVAHVGGKRISRDAPAFEILLSWIEQGRQTEKKGEPTCNSIEVYPKQRTLHWPDCQQQLSVLARFSDGSIRDVTSLAVYKSSDEQILTIDAQGLVFAEERGQATVVVRYLEHFAAAPIKALRDVEGFVWSDPPQNNLIDKLVFLKLKELQIEPSDLCTDSEFIRRVYLDLLGTLPPRESVEAFLADANPQKRNRLIDALLQRGEYAEFWSLRWSDLLRVKNSKMTELGVHKFNRWLTRAIRDNMPYDQMARRLLTASGSTYLNPPANYFRAAADVNDCAENTSQLFLGIRIQCAKCHNHPFERWSQDNYYGIGAFFNRIQRKETQTPGEMFIWTSSSGEVVQPSTGKNVKPWLPLQGDVKIHDQDDRREVFAHWLISPENPFFARVGANRIWGYLMGRGIVEPVDDFRQSNPPSNGPLLDALAAEFIRCGFDQKHLIRTILQSRTYQLSSLAKKLNEKDIKYFSHAQSRMLTAEQLLDAVCRVTGVDEKFRGFPIGARATQLPSPDVDNGFLKIFGQPARNTSCECERLDNPKLTHALQLINGELISRKIHHSSGRLAKALHVDKDRQIITDLYLTAYSRPPTGMETDFALKYIASAEDRRQALEDLYWAILNSKEFLFQH